jgi:hypothetical protein
MTQGERISELEADLADLRGKVNTLCEAMVIVTRFLPAPPEPAPERPRLRVIGGSEPPDVGRLSPPRGRLRVVR